MAYISKKDFDQLHDKVDKQGECLARIEGKLEGINSEKKDGLTALGILIAFALGVVNMFK